MEVMVGAPTEVASATRQFLAGFRLIGLGERIAAMAVELRQRHKIKLPDAVIWATAREGAMLLVTRNTKDFPADDPGVRVPYAL
jgi:predicted nucleic acid-binding protein